METLTTESETVAELDAETQVGMNAEHDCNPSDDETTPHEVVRIGKTD